MPIYQEDEEKLTVQFERDVSLTLTLRKDADCVGMARRFTSKTTETDLIAKRIARLEGELKEGEAKLTLEQVQEKLAEIEKLRALPDWLGYMVDYIYAMACGWDNYLSREHERRGEAIPFTKDNIQKIHPNRLGRIIQELNRFWLGTDETGEAKGATSPAPSTREGGEVGSTQAGTSNSETIKPLPTSSTSV